MRRAGPSTCARPGRGRTGSSRHPAGTRRPHRGGGTRRACRGAARRRREHRPGRSRALVDLEGARRLADDEAREEPLHLGLRPPRAIARIPRAVRVASLGRQGLAVRTRPRWFGVWIPPTTSASPAARANRSRSATAWGGTSGRVRRTTDNDAQTGSSTKAVSGGEWKFVVGRSIVPSECWRARSAREARLNRSAISGERWYRDPDAASPDTSACARPAVPPGEWIPCSSRSAPRHGCEGADEPPEGVHRIALGRPCLADPGADRRSRDTRAGHLQESSSRHEAPRGGILRRLARAGPGVRKSPA